MSRDKYFILLSLLLSQLAGGGSASQYHSCPPVGSSTFLEGVTDPVTLETTASSGEVCILSLVTPQAHKPVARSYDGRNWERSAGSLSGIIGDPLCSNGHCNFTLPIDADTLDNGNYKYALTSYFHSTTRDAEVARFLEQATFGLTKAGIEALSSTSSPDGSPDFAAWVEHQLNPTESGAGMSAHREFFRSHMNQRFEYQNRAGGAGPATACEINSRWRKFTLTERDGLLDWKSKISKWVHFKAVGKRFIWFVEGMARTSTDALPILKDKFGRQLRQAKVTDMFRISDGSSMVDNMKYSCIGCPVELCSVWWDICGYVENPPIDMLGILGTNRLLNSLVELPPINDGSDKMIPMDNGPYIKVLEPFQQPNDEYRLNASIDQSQCAKHFSTLNPINSLFSSVSATVKVDKASTPVFGRTLNAQTGKVEYLMFDPQFKFLENTVENPLPDGGGRIWSESDGLVFCANAPRSFVNEDYCKLSVDPMACEFDDQNKAYNSGAGTVVCGSPGEVASDPSHDIINSFDIKTMKSGADTRDIYTDRTFTAQKNTVWYHLALKAEDQLRQRMAWALYQIVPISAPGGFVAYTEEWLVYYDIFVRHALGNYRNVLKEISYQDLMGEWLSFVNNGAIQYHVDTGAELHFPDENYAREIMQLFSIGVVQLNMDGTHKLDKDGNEILTYTSSDIMSYARAWTGFKKARFRGNHEASYRRFSSYRSDPMVINRDIRDIFPKTDLFGGYIGDGFPLCADLPDKDFLREGATYRLLGRRSRPELQEDEEQWETGGVRLALDQSSPLYAKLCAPNAHGACTFPGKVVLDESLYDLAAQTGAEYEVDTIRSVRIQATPYPIYYEYVRPACVNQNFFNDGKKILRGPISKDVVYDSMCADPRLYLAAESCCEPNWESGTGTTANRYCAYNGERMRYSSAVNRCLENGKEQCHQKRFASDVCMDQSTYSWSMQGCQVRVKIAFEKEHNIARVDFPGADYTNKQNVKNFVSDETVNYFKATFNGNIDIIPEDKDACDNLNDCYSVTDGCVCDTNVVERAIFNSKDDITSKDDIVKKLHIGAFAPDFFGAGVYINLGDCGILEVQVYSKNGGDCNSLDSETIFFYENEYGVNKYMKNMNSTVEISGMTGVSFRNPVHFIDFADRSLRDIHQETDAVIDSVFYHPSHAPFLAVRILQRFGISNPSPNYVKRVATAYKQGSYQDRFGSGKYGDLDAMIAAVLLDPESRAVSLDADPGHGHIREPILKITSLLRSMDSVIHAPLSVPFMDLDGVNKVGQYPYRTQSVFSFFLPEYAPSGIVSDSGLVAPESSVLDVRLMNLINSFFSTIKFGLSSCHSGFGYMSYGRGTCQASEGTIVDEAMGEFGFAMESTADMDQIVDELSLLLTSSRLSANNKDIIKQIANEAYTSGDKAKAIRIAQQLIVASPEFHTTNLVKKTGIPRQLSGYSREPSHNYRAVVYFMMEGGADSFNLLVPKGNCVNNRNVFQEYTKARQAAALPSSQLLNIDATGSNQICNSFGVNNNFSLLHTLYSQNEALFFANTGVLTKPMTKHDNWIKESKIQLFAHNHMIQENYAMDPLKKIAGTGIGGRMMDILKRQGYHTSSNMVDGAYKFAKGFAADNNPTWNVGTLPLKEFDTYSTVGPSMLDEIKKLNGEGDVGTSIYGETFSSRLSQSLFEYESERLLNDALEKGDVDMSAYPSGEPFSINARLRAVAKYMKLRDFRKVDRDVFIVRQLGYDHHKDNGVGENFAVANGALTNFVDEMKREGLWENTLIIMGSDFGRSISANSNGGTDHAWGGNYFILGGSVKGGQILGKYPEYLDERSDEWIMRGRIIPTTSWDQIWNGVAQWMGLRGDRDLDDILPNRENFDKCSLFTDSDLFVDGHVEHSTCSIRDSDGDGISDDIDECPNTMYKDLDNVEPNGCVTGEPPSPLPPSTPSPTQAPGPQEAPVSVKAPTPLPTKAPTPSPTLSPTANPSIAQPTSPPLVGITPVNTILSTGTKVVRVGGSHNKNPVQAIDGTTVKFLVVKDGTMSPGAQFTPTWPKTIVTGIRIYTADDAKARDPASYVLEGRTSAESPWVEISSGDLNLPDLRNPQLKPITSTATAPDVSKYHQEIKFSNTAFFSEYRLYFPTTKSATSGIMQIAEVELPGSLIPLEKTPTVDPTRSPTSPTQSPSRSPTLSPFVMSGKVANVIDPASPNYLVGTEYTDWSAQTAFDGITNRMGIPISIALVEAPGFVVKPSVSSVVKGIRVYTNDSWSSRDPMSYKLYGRNGDADEWYLISEGPLSLPLNRNIQGIAINSSFESGDPNLHHQKVLFYNDAAFSEYMVNFPTTRGNDIGLVVAEVELPGYLVADSPVPPPTTPTPPTAAPVTPAQVPTVSPTFSPSRDPTVPPARSPTKAPTLSPVAAPSGGHIIPVNNVLSTATKVVRVGGSHNKNPFQAIDETTVKFLVVKDETMDPGSPGAQFTLLEPSVVTGIRIYTANDAKARDPASYVLEGRTSSESPWVEISSGDLNLPDLRNPQSNFITSTATAPDVSKYHQEIKFSNTAVFLEYRLYFPTTKGATSDIMQIAEVELPGYYF